VTQALQSGVAICDDDPVMTQPVDRESPSFEGWQPLPADLEGSGDASLPRRRARSWSLVLEARAIPWREEQRGFGRRLLVPPGRLEEALRELRHYERENQAWPPPLPPPAALVDNRATTLWVLIAVAVFYNLTLHDINLAGHRPVDWSALGNADAGRILAGEWWRLLTALTLHADWQHLLGNLLIGAFFIVRLCRDLRSGPAWLLLLLAGGFGNLANALLQSAEHRSVGASTAIFGAVGILAALSMVRYRHSLRPRRRSILPVAAALGLLAMLGAGGDNTDLGAHLFGFLFGLPLGAAAELIIERHGHPRWPLNLVLATTALTLITTAWACALYS
jgi:membrane associated rhomboid family serine protease